MSAKNFLAGNSNILPNMSAGTSISALQEVKLTSQDPTLRQSFPMPEPITDLNWWDGLVTMAHGFTCVLSL
ncbi:MAG: hypothetical protein LBL92_06665 [Propionibacteriaceae bacterium]|nr:hypothetical protein [Propionibacteriaceae bacterium]